MSEISPLLVLGVSDAGTPLLFDILLLFGLALVVTFIFDRLKIPTIVGFLLTGILAGPNGMGLVKGVESVETLADIGVILLLFSIGVEFSLSNLNKLKGAVLVGGGLQAGLTIAVVMGFFLLTDTPLSQAIFFAFLVTLSSTAIVLKLLQQRAEMDAPQGRLSVGILIFQDLLIVPMMLVTPMLAGEALDQGPWAIPLLLLKAVGVVVVIVIGARYVVPWIFFQIAGMRDREVFNLSVICVVLAVAWLTAGAGLSLALGAFLAGLIISESEYSERALGSILPFRDIFMSLFFISIGMLFDFGAFLQEPFLIVSAAMAVLLLKLMLIASVVLLLGYPLRIALLTGLAICQVGEFSFVLSKAGLETELLGPDFYQVFLAVSIISMIATPFLIMAGPKITSRLLRSRPSRSAEEVSNAKDLQDSHFSDHLIIVGFGPTGRYVARAARAAKIPYLIIEMNPQTVRTEQRNNEPIYYGDATQETVLEHAGIDRARVCLIVIADGPGSRRVTQIAHIMNPSLHIVVRTRFIAEIDPLVKLGANEVIPEELETAVEILTRVMFHYLVPAGKINEFVDEMRAGGYEMLRSGTSAERLRLRDYLPDLEFHRVPVEERLGMDGKTLSELDLRSHFGITVVAVRRGSETNANPRGDFQLQNGDELLVLGKLQKLLGLQSDIDESSAETPTESNKEE